MKRKNIYPLYIVMIPLLALLTLFSCTNASENDLIDPMELPELITYQSNVKAIIDNNCTVCHSQPPINGAPIPLTSYENVKNAIENNGLIERISSNDLAILMPFGGPRLPQNLIDIIIQWKSDGFLEE